MLGAAIEQTGPRPHVVVGEAALDLAGKFGQVVVPEVTIPTITKIIPLLVEEGYLESHVPVREPATNKTLQM